MGRQAVETPVKYCEQCGKPYERKRVGKSSLGRQAALECVTNFLKRRFCSLSCSVYNQHSRPAPSIAASRKRASSMRTDRCGACGLKTLTSCHHIDGDPMNNDDRNRQTLCLHCHSFWHGVLKRTGRSFGQPMPALFRS